MKLMEEMEKNEQKGRKIRIKQGDMEWDGKDRSTGVAAAGHGKMARERG